MKLIPKSNNFLYILQDHSEDIKEAKLNLDRSTLPSGGKLMISFNGYPYQKFYQGMVIPEKYQKEQYIKLNLRHYSTENKFKEYEADTLPVTHLALVGKTLDAAYPKLATHVLEVTKNTEERLAKLEKAFEEFKERGDIF